LYPRAKKKYTEEGNEKEEEKAEMEGKSEKKLQGEIARAGYAPTWWIFH